LMKSWHTDCDHHLKLSIELSLAQDQYPFEYDQRDLCRNNKQTTT
jgi:hypothetical protein